MTVLDAIKRKYPEVEAEIVQNGIWNYSVYSPISLDDPIEIEIRIAFGTERKLYNKTFKLTALETV